MKQKRYLSALLLALVLMAMCPANLRAQSTFSGSGSGTSADPYQIATAAQLGEFRDLVNAGNATYNAASVYYVLTDNIDLSSVCHAKDDANSVAEANWTPIGTATNPFKGTFNGQGHSITNMYIHYATLNQGLFGKTNGATVKNFSISGKMESSTSNVEGSVQCIGGVIGWAYNSTVEDITSSVNITLDKGITQKLMGGVVGDCDGTTISGCLYNGTLDAGNSGDCVGGITGYFRADAKTTKGYQIANCCNAGSVTTTAISNAVAGILGYSNSGNFMGAHNCLNTGKITAGAETKGGAIYGQYKSTSNIGSNNYYKAGTAYKGVCNVTESSQQPESVCTSVTEKQLASGEVCYLLNGKKSTGTLAWYQNLGTPGDATPVLKSTGNNTVYCGYSGCTLTYANSALSGKPEHNYVDGVCSVCGAYENEPVKVTDVNASGFGLTTYYVGYYAITNVAELKWFANVVNNKNATYNNIKVVLTANIDLSSVCHAASDGVQEANWTPIGTATNPFKGIFDGQGHSITNMYIKYTTGNQGLFGYIYRATLQNFSVSGKLESGTAGAAGIGGVVGTAQGDNSATSVITRVTNNVNITVDAGVAQDRVAGIAGDASDVAITYCVNNGNIDAGATPNTKTVGGIAGYATSQGKIWYCLNNGEVKSTSDAYLGGILGYINTYTFEGVQYCLNLGTISKNSYNSAIIGYTKTGLYTYGDNYHSNYYLNTSASRGFAQEKDDYALKSKAATSVTTAQLSNGEVCYLLNGKTSTGTLTWYQTIGTDNIPVLSSNHQVVYNDGGSYNNPYTVTASNVGYTGQEASKAFDRSTDTKWCGNSGSGTSIYVEFNTSNPMKVGSYTFTTADDATDYPVRNPKTWVLKGKVNSTDAEWTTIDTQTSSTKMPAANKTAVTFYLPALTATAYKYFRIDFTHAQNTTFQLSEITLSSATCEHKYDAYHYCSKCGNYDATYVKASGTDGTCRWAIFKNADANYSDGEMVIYPSSGTSGTLAKWGLLDNLPGWNGSKTLIKSVRFAGNIKAQTLVGMFKECKDLVSVDFTNLNTSDVASMIMMFYQCYSLTSVNFGSGFNTSNVEALDHLFKSCHTLTSLDLSSFNIAKVKSMSYMFYDCYVLQSITLGNFDMQNVSETTNMFGNNRSKVMTLNLKAVPYLKNGTFNNVSWTNVNYLLDDNSVIYTGATNYLPAATTAPIYTRTVAAASNWGTMVLPYESKSDANVKLYTISAVGTDLTLTSVATVAANTPCLFKKQVENATSVTMTANSTTAAPAAATPVTPATVNGITLTGKYALTEITDNNGYIISNNSFWSIQHSKGSNKVYCAPFRAYLASQSAVSRSQMRIGDYTGTTAVQALDAIVSGTARYFDLSGREINDLQPGMNIVMYSNGKTAKVFVNETADQTKAVNTMSHQTRSQVEPEFYSESGSIWCE